MTTLRVFVNGFRAAMASPRLLALLWILLLCVAVPFGLAMQDEIAEGIGASRVHEDLRHRMDMVWLGEFRERSGTLGQTLEPVKVGPTDFLHNLDLLLGGRLLAEHRGLVAAGLVYGVLSVLLLGGVIDRFARGGGRFVLSQFFGACGRYFPRLLKLTVISALLYWGLFRLAEWSYSALGKATQDVTVESTVLRYYLLALVPLLLLAGLVMLVVDYARIASILEEENNTLRALRRGARFVLRRPMTVFGLAGLGVICGAGLVALRTVSAPSVAESTAVGVALVFLLGQLFLIARQALRLTLVAAEVGLYRELR